MFTCIGSMKAWDLRQCRSFHYNHRPYTGTTEETEKGKLSPKENCRVLEKRIFSLPFDLFSLFSSFSSQTVVEVMCSSHLYLEGSVAGEQPRLLTDLPFEVSANMIYIFYDAISISIGIILIIRQESLKKSFHSMSIKGSHVLM